MVPYTWQVFDSAAADQYNTMLLQVVPDAGDIGGDFDSIGQTDSGNFSQGGIRLLWRHGLNRCAHASLDRKSVV